jgi:hypothetical protein
MPRIQRVGPPFQNVFMRLAVETIEWIDAAASSIGEDRSGFIRVLIQHGREHPPEWLRLRLAEANGSPSPKRNPVAATGKSR